MSDSRIVFHNRAFFASISSFSLTVRKFFSLSLSRCIFLSLNTFLCFSCPDVLLPLSLSRVSPPLLGTVSMVQSGRVLSYSLSYFTG